MLLVVIMILFMLATTVIFLYNKKIQTLIAQVATIELSEYLQTDIHIGKLEYKFFNKLAISDLQIDDQHGHKMISVNSIEAQFDLWGFFSKRFTIQQLDLDSAYFFMETDTAGMTNIAFFQRLFNNPNAQFDALVEVKAVTISSSQLKIRDMRYPQAEPGMFSLHDIDIEQIEAIVAMQHLSPDSLNAQIDHLSFKERSGLQLIKMQSELIANRKCAMFPELSIKLPNSYLSMDTVTFVYDSITRNTVGNLAINIPLNQSNISLADISPLHPSIKNMNGTVTLQAHAKGTLHNLKIDNIALDYNYQPVLRGQAQFNGLPDISQTFIYAEISDLSFSKGTLQDFLSDMTNRPFTLPSPMAQLGKMKYKGYFSGFYNNMVAYGTLNTMLGNVSMDLLLKASQDFSDLTFSGNIKTTRFKLGRLLGNNQIGNISFSIGGTAQQDSIHPLHGKIDGNIKRLNLKGYAYKDIKANGHFNNKGFDGKLSIKDPNLMADFNGIIDLSKKIPVFHFNLDLDRFDPKALKLYDKYANANLKAKLAVNMTGNSLDNLNGEMLLDSLLFTNGDKNIAINNFIVSSTTTENTTKVVVQSDILKAHFAGKYLYSELPGTFQHIVYNYLPSLFTSKQIKEMQSLRRADSMEFSVYLYSTRQLSEALELPFSFNDISMVKGHFNNQGNHLVVRLGIPNATWGKAQLNNITLSLEGNKKDAQLALFMQQGSSHTVSYMTHITAQQDTLSTRINWSNSDSTANKGTFNAMLTLQPGENIPQAQLEILPTQIILTDSIWQLSSGPIVLLPDTTIQIQDFDFQSNTQLLHVDGRIGRTHNDSLSIQLKEIDLGYIINMLPGEMEVSFGGDATGVANIYSTLKQPVFNADILLKNGQINEAPVGDVYANALWDRENQEIRIKGHSTQNNDTVAIVNGTIAPLKDSIDFYYDARGFSVGLLNRYMNSFAENVTGNGYGKLRMYGRLSQKNDIHFEGQAYIKNGSMKISMLGTPFYFNDTITMTRTAILLDNIDLTDAEGHPATLNGQVKHDGSFQDLTYRIRINCNNLLAMNTTMADNDFFFGKVYASGNVTISGNEYESNINVNARTEPHTTFNISLASAAVATDNSFITFLDPNKIEITEDKNIALQPQSNNPESHVKLRLAIDVTPNATLQLIIDPKTGDVLTARGNGSMAINYDSNGDNVRLLGTYTIESGDYQFTLQNVFRKNFKIAQGSSITWTGDPFMATVNIKALYSLTASLRDLMDDVQIEATTKRTTVPVNCILNLTGQLTSPNIQFDIDLPNSDEALKQQVRNIINTEEMMNRQILYLLIFNKFYTPEYIRASNTSVSQNEAYSLLSSTVTGQINNWISKLTSDFSFGFNVRSYGEGETATQEYETEILYQPNNRLIVNGNFGYRNDNIATNKFIGDVDVEYVLTQNGKLRLKAYTHTVDKYSLKTAQTMQGVGLIYKEEFNSVGELLNDYWKALQKAFTPKKKKKKEPTNTSEE